MPIFRGVWNTAFTEKACSFGVQTGTGTGRLTGLRKRPARGAQIPCP
jgi:hypothetical protein